MEKLVHHHGVEGLAALGRAPAFGIQANRDLGRRQAGIVESTKALLQGFEVAELLEPPDWPLQFMSGTGSAGPVAGYGHPFAVALDRDHNTVEQKV